MLLIMIREFKVIITPQWEGLEYNINQINFILKILILLEQGQDLREKDLVHQQWLSIFQIICKVQQILAGLKLVTEWIIIKTNLMRSQVYLQWTLQVIIYVQPPITQWWCISNRLEIPLATSYIMTILISILISPWSWLTIEIRRKHNTLKIITMRVDFIVRMIL